SLIADLLRTLSQVTLFTRPRRFGKTLNMSMLKSFFEIGTDQTLFDGLAISKEADLCNRFMGRFPVLFVSMKGIEGLDFDTAVNRMKNLISSEAARFSLLEDSEKLSDRDKNLYATLSGIENGMSVMSFENLLSSLKDLTYLLEKHYGNKAIILIDEYDVPLDKAFQNGYYDEMILLIRGMLSEALKTNPHLLFAVLTGCLRISKESIFTGLNNIEVNTIADKEFEEYFGFTETETTALLEYYSLEDRLSLIREWYDGYRFGDCNLYCPWDVISYCKALLADPDKLPQNYWANTSSNALVARLLSMADYDTQDDLELLMEDIPISRSLKPDLTYNELDTSTENLWSVLFSTGYLTLDSSGRLIIPNKEIKSLFVTQIQSWFQNRIVNNKNTFPALCHALLSGDFEQIETILNEYLLDSIGIHDMTARNSIKENFYHGILFGALKTGSGWAVKSNEEAGDGYSDIIIRDKHSHTGIVIEIKYAFDGNLEKTCDTALTQIVEKHYDQARNRDGLIDQVHKYGIAFFKKRCKVKKL
ncbi:MAG: AAA family ATPase, partial [Lachnospiraceae bacterium]|nr:AAA family ATPase [Lachnospiraceae bacterium]